MEQSTDAQKQTKKYVRGFPRNSGRLVNHDNAVILLIQLK